MRPDSVLGVGTDLVDVDRIRRALERHPGLRTRLFTDDEWSYASRHRDPHPHLAARFAGKESVMKALGHGISQIGFDEIGILRGDGGAPAVALTGRAADLAKGLGVVEWQLSLTHTSSLAQAVALAIGTPRAGGAAA